MGLIKNTDRISWIKRDKVVKGMQYLDYLNKGKHMIDKVVIYGSAVTDQCDSNCPINICLFIKKDAMEENETFFSIFSGLELVMDDICDIVSYYELRDNKLKNTINRKGVVVYTSR